MFRSEYPGFRGYHCPCSSTPVYGRAILAQTRPVRQVSICKPIVGLQALFWERDLTQHVRVCWGQINGQSHNGLICLALNHSHMSCLDISLVLSALAPIISLLLFPPARPRSKEEDAIQRRTGDRSSKGSRCRTLGTLLSLPFPCDTLVCVCCRAGLERREGPGDTAAP
jgi:hypothetical protein